MKIQCSCGAKYEFDVTPDMAQRPVQFVCPSCGLDSSQFVTDLVRQQLGIAKPATPSATVSMPAPMARPAVPVAQALPSPSAPVRVGMPTPVARPAAPVAQ